MTLGDVDRRPSPSTPSTWRLRRRGRRSLHHLLLGSVAVLASVAVLGRVVVAAIVGGSVAVLVVVAVALVGM